MQGNCEGVASPLPVLNANDGPLRDLLPRQCLLLVDADLLEVDDSKLWLDGLYVRLTSPRGEDGFAELIYIQPSGELWMTDVTLQGNGNSDFGADCSNCGMDVRGSVYAEGVHCVPYYYTACRCMWYLYVCT